MTICKNMNSLNSLKKSIFRNEFFPNSILFHAIHYTSVKYFHRRDYNVIIHVAEWNARSFSIVRDFAGNAKNRVNYSVIIHLMKFTSAKPARNTWPIIPSIFKFKTLNFSLLKLKKLFPQMSNRRNL